VQATNNCYATTNDFMGKPTSENCFGGADSYSVNVDTNAVANPAPNGDPTDPTGSYQGVWFHIDIGPGANPALQNKLITVSTCFSTFDTVLRAFKVNSAFNLTAGTTPDLDDCAGIARADIDTLEGVTDAFADDNEDTTGCGVGTDRLSFRTTEAFEIDGVRWYFLVTSSDKAAALNAGVAGPVRSFTSCGKAQLSCKLVV